MYISNNVSGVTKDIARTHSTGGGLFNFNDMEAVKRRAPKLGYNNNAKEEYRDNVWRNIFPIIENDLRVDKNAKVLLLPSKEGLEIDVAIRQGVDPSQIIAIDENPALLAHAKWKDKIPKENRFGCKVSKIGEKIKSNGWYLVASNLDFCNNFSDEVIGEIQSFIDTRCCSDRFVMSVTLMKGRESRALFKLIKKTGSGLKFTHARMGVLFEVLDLPSCSINIVHEGSYYETSPMIYSVCVINTKNKVILTDDNINMIRKNMHNRVALYEDAKIPYLGAVIYRPGYKPEYEWSTDFGYWVDTRFIDRDDINDVNEIADICDLNDFERHEVVSICNADEKIHNLQYSNISHDSKYSSCISVDDGYFPGAVNGSGILIQPNNASWHKKYRPTGKKRIKHELLKIDIKKEDYLWCIDYINKSEGDFIEISKAIKEKIESIGKWQCHR